MVRVFILIIIALLVRLPLLGTVYWRTPDAVEYVDVARNIAAGEGFIQKIKYTFFDSSPVVTSALHGRPLATSVIFAVILHLTDSVYWLQAFIILVNVVNVVLLYWLAQKFLAGWWPFSVAIFATLNPNAFISSRLLLSETIFAFFVLLALVIFHSEKVRFKYLIIGILCALAFLTRFEGIIFLVILLFYSGKKQIGLTFLALTLPYFIANYQTNGSPFYSYNLWHFRVRQFQEGMAAGFGQNFPTAWVFVRENPGFIITQICRNFINHLASLFDFRYLGLLSIPLVLAVKKYLRKFKLIFLFAGAIVLIYTSLWSAIFETSRHFILIYYLLLIPTFYYLASRKLKWTKVVLVTMFILYLTSDAKRLVWAREVDPTLDNWSPRTKSQLFSWIKQNTNSGDVISSVDPFLVNHFTLRPAIITPNNLSYKEFIQQYSVRYFLVDDPNKFSDFDHLAKLQTEIQGVRVYSPL